MMLFVMKNECNCDNDAKYKSLSFASNDFTMGRRRVLRELEKVEHVEIDLVWEPAWNIQWQQMK